MEDELVQYYIVNSELKMSTGKVSAQVAHVASDIASDLSSEQDYEFIKIMGRTQDPDYLFHCEQCEKFTKWQENDQPKIILRGKLNEMEKLIKQGWYFIRDNGRTEIPIGSLTCIGYPPEYKSIMKRIVKRFQLL